MESTSWQYVVYGNPFYVSLCNPFLVKNYTFLADRDSSQPASQPASLPDIGIFVLVPDRASVRKGKRKPLLANISFWTDCTPLPTKAQSGSWGNCWTLFFSLEFSLSQDLAFYFNVSQISAPLYQASNRRTYYLVVKYVFHVWQKKPFKERFVVWKRREISFSLSFYPLPLFRTVFANRR